MPNVIDQDGIHIEDYNTTFDNIVEAWTSIYGNINTESNSPDGQALGIFAQAKQDMLDLAVSMYNCMDPDKCEGNAQDILYKLNGIIRKASTFTYVRVNITTSRTVSLSGLDNNALNPDGVGYTVSDANGNQFILINSQSLPIGTTTCDFRAATAGRVEVQPNTIVNMVTVVPGVVSVNNIDSEYLLGDNMETNAEFRLRRSKSTALPSQGFNDGLEAQLLDINDLTDVQIDNNRSNETNSNGTPAHTIWVIVEGGTDAEVAEAIYNNVTDGCGMRGAIKYAYQKKSGKYQNVFFDRGIEQPLYIKANIRPTTVPADEIEVEPIAEQLAAALSYSLAEDVDSSEINCVLRSLVVGGFPYDVELSSNGVDYYELVSPSTIQHKFIVNPENIKLTVVENGGD